MTMWDFLKDEAWIMMRYLGRQFGRLFRFVVKVGISVEYRSRHPLHSEPGERSK